MRPFNLEEAKAGKPFEIEYHPSFPIRFIAHVPELKHVVAYIDSHETVKVSFWSEDGDYLDLWNFGESSLKLVMTPVKKTVWVNIYPTNDGFACWHDSEEKANKELMEESPRLGGKAYPIEIEE